MGVERTSFERIRKKFLESRRAIYGHPSGSAVQPRFGAPRVQIFHTFASRKECSALKVHTKNYAGISGSSTEGAFSICVSNGYKDDKDEGETILYTGTGGQSDSFRGSGAQVADQSFEHRDNAALKVSARTKKPVRVVRGPNPDSVYAPDSGYRYDGLYTVERAYMDRGANGFAICRYELRRCPGQPPIPKKGEHL
ncbi:hypothetical protein GALMADRAFT_252199 [Galerina marginata CBS 339.88]|uniref:YDG domain-containing protein n=1 Tax=Galerina marginata (strain CBS 339.88) TaxID=685588 RepID=A0A067SS53_GALM3|nr:hypothetical protein GALMADRAFT_252199 [Galerina marginata CBS 339.88]